MTEVNTVIQIPAQPFYCRAVLVHPKRSTDQAPIDCEVKIQVKQAEQDSWKDENSYKYKSYKEAKAIANAINEKLVEHGRMID